MTTIKPVSARSQAYVRRRMLADMTARVRVLRMPEPDLDGITLIMVTGAEVLVYGGPARIRVINGGGPIIVGEESIATANTAISIPFNAPMPRIDDVVLVDTMGSDIEQITRAFAVKDVDGGGLIRAIRTMTCSAYQDNQWWLA